MIMVACEGNVNEYDYDFDDHVSGCGGAFKADAWGNSDGWD